MMRSLSNIFFCLLLTALSSCQPKSAPPPETEKRKDPFLIDAPAVDEVVKFQTVPAGASISLSTGESCKSPCNITKQSNDTFDVRIEKKGYKPTTVTVISHARVTPGSGANGVPTIEQPHLQPNPVKVTLEPAWSKH